MRSLDQIQESLAGLFTSHQLVFWDDLEGVYEQLMPDLQIESVKFILVGQTPFQARVELRAQDQTQKVLIYRQKFEPSKNDWLLDLKCYAVSFEPDSLEQVSIGLPEQAKSLVERYPAFFQSEERTSLLQSVIVGRELTTKEIGTLMVFLAAKLPFALSDSVDLAGLLFDPIKWANLSRDLEALGIEDLFWAELEQNFGYSASEKSREDFLFEIFSRILESATMPGLTRGALRTSHDAASKSLVSQLRGKNIELWERVVNYVERELGIETTLSNIPTEILLGVDFFPSVDRILSVRIGKEAVSDTRDLSLIRDVVEARLKLPSAKKFKHDYLLAQATAEIASTIREVDIYCADFQQGVTSYASTWWELDYWYRRAVQAFKQSSHPGELQTNLYDIANNLYCNVFLRPLGDSWQIAIDAVSKWHDQQSLEFTHHRDFYQKHVVPETHVHLNRTAVIISDAFRYEVGREFEEIIGSSGKFDATTKTLIAPLPSYTKLGMASLLPNSSLALKPDASADVLVDGRPSGSTEYRNQILSSVGGVAITAEEALNDSELKKSLKDSNLVYVYHNRIDAIGDKVATEVQTFEAVEATFVELKGLIDKLEKAGFPVIFVTADHGFIYQNSDLEPLDYLSEEAEGDETPFQNRRFIIGSGLVEGAGFKKFSSEQLGLASDHEFLIPKSIRRLRRRGAGARFVHGGASLQEIVVPLVELRARDNRKISPVEFQVIAESDLITTVEPAFKVLQNQAVSATRTALELRVFLSCDGETISEQKIISLASIDEEIRNRYVQFSLALLPNAQRFANREIELSLEVRVGTTQRFKAADKKIFKLVKTIEQDF